MLGKFHFTTLISHVDFKIYNFFLQTFDKFFSEFQVAYKQFAGSSATSATHFWQPCLAPARSQGQSCQTLRHSMPCRHPLPPPISTSSPIFLPSRLLVCYYRAIAPCDTFHPCRMGPKAGKAQPNPAPRYLCGQGCIL